MKRVARMVFSNDYAPQQPLLPNSNSYSTTSHFGLDINPFQHQNFTPEMGNFFLPQSPFYHHHQDPPPNNEATPSSYLPNHPNLLHCNQEVEALSLSKKDRNTKIWTAHGFRDRRVRLSMEVAREFFDLQDMLGFDKASKTLGWLLANSKSAIEQLALEKKSLESFSMFDTSHEDPVGGSTPMRMRRRKKIRVLSDVGKEQSINSVVAKEKRAKARERARERTREKMCSKLQFEEHHGGFHTNGYCFSDLNCISVQGDDPEATISSLLGWNTYGN